MKEMSSERVRRTVRPKEEIEKCPIYHAAKVVGKKWTILIIQELLVAGTLGLRFHELRDALGDISPKVLTQRLRSLQREGLVVRDVDTATIPPSVTYSLAASGRDLQDVIEALQTWGRKYRAEEVRECAGKGIDSCKVCSTRWMDVLLEEIPETPSG